MKTKTRYLAALVSVALLASFEAMAQVAGAVNVPGMISGAGCATSAIFYAGGPFADGSGAGYDADAFKTSIPDASNPTPSPQMSVPDARTSVSANGTADDKIHGPGVTANGKVTLGAGLPANVDVENTMHAINVFIYEERNRLSHETDDRIDATKARIKALHQQVEALSAKAQAQFKDRIENVKAKEEVLKQSLKEAHKASATAWAEVRAKVARSYQAYADAVANAEADATGNATTKK
jgi:hypothetical protein